LVLKLLNIVKGSFATFLWTSDSDLLVKGTFHKNDDHQSIHAIFAFVRGALNAPNAVIHCIVHFFARVSSAPDSLA
jgi:hypothetical protein